MSRRYDAYATGARAGYKRGKRSVYRSRGYKKLKAGYAPGRRRHRGWGIQYHQPTNDTANSFGRSWQEATDVQKQNRRAQNYYGRGRYYSGRGRYYSGRGGYFSKWGRMARNTGRMVGRQARRAAHTLDAAAPIAAMIPGVGPELALGMEAASAGLGDVASVGRHIRGSGQYSAPLINSSETLELGQRFGAPHFTAGGVSDDDGGLCVSNQEFVANVYGNENGIQFSTQVFTVNPGLAQTFPMLSQFAVNFERYEMIQCVFHYETALDSGVLQSTTGQVGDILMYSHVDPTEPAFESVADFLANGGSTAQVTKGLACGVECDPEQLSGLPNSGLNFVRSGPQIDAKQAEADQSTLQIAVADTPDDLAGHVIGKLYVSYTVKLVKPRLVSLHGGNIMHDTFTLASRRSLVDDTGVMILPPSGATVPPRLPHSNIGGTIQTSSSSADQTLTYTLPPWLNGVFKLRLRVMSDDPPTGDSDVQAGSTWTTPPHQNIIQQLVQTVTTTGNVKVLPHGVRLSAINPFGGHTTLVHYDSADHTEVDNFSLDGAIDNYIVFNADNTGGSSRLMWGGYFEVTIRCSPSTASVDNTVKLKLPSDQQHWPAPDLTVSGNSDEMVMCYMKFDVESSNGFDIPSTTRLTTHLDNLAERNTELAAYEANPV